MDYTRSFAVQERFDGLRDNSAAAPRAHRHTHLWRPVPHAETRSPGGDDPVRRALVRPGPDGVAYQALLIWHDPALDALVIVLEDDVPDRRARLVRRGVGGCGVADWTDMRGGVARDQFTADERVWVRVWSCAHL